LGPGALTEVNAPLSGAPLMELRRVSKRFGSQWAVADVSFSLRPGEIFGLLGPNGAGKTTLLRMAVDLLRPDEGAVEIFGHPPRPEALERIGYLPEERGLPSRARALHFLIYLGELKGMAHGAAREQARALLRRMQLDAGERSKIGTLSKGNQQKIQMAAALMGDPKVLLIDEPFSGLDPMNQTLVLQLLQETVACGKAVLISTHQLQHVEQLCHRMLLLNRGRIVLEGEVDPIRKSYADGSVLVRGSGDFAALPGVQRVAPAAKGTNGEHPVRLYLRPGVTAENILQQVVERRLSLDSFAPHVPTLEEIFVRAVGGWPDA
jgi:ABC-2 type transport system ATP-binding protein